MIDLETTHHFHHFLVPSGIMSPANDVQWILKRFGERVYSENFILDLPS